MTHEDSIPASGKDEPMKPVTFRIERMQHHADNLKRILTGRVTAGGAICILIMLIPYLLAPQLDLTKFMQIPSGFILIAQISPIVLCVVVYLYSRIQEKHDLQMDDET